jgi:predicted AlkP superfamily pyrophosphatase or phosphodiesterase
MIRLLASISFLLVSLCTAAQIKSRKTVFIIVDGIPADVIRKLDPPHLKKISAVGGFAPVLVGGEKGRYNQTPTISAVGYNSVLTGVWVNKHNVWDNDIAAPNYHYPTVFRLFKTQYPQKKIGIFSSWEDNRTKLVGDSMAATGFIPFDYKFDGLEHDTINYPHDANRDFMHRIDEKVVDVAASTIREQAPDLSWVYLEYTDDMGHGYGDSPEFYKAIDYADKQVGKIWDAINYRQQNFGEDWLMVITTDHGRDSATGKDHGGQSPREKLGWIVTNAKDLNQRFRQGNAAIIDILPTITQFMNINVPQATAREVDGVSLTGPLSVTDADASFRDNNLLIRWKSPDQSGKIKIWLATTNNRKNGNDDEYIFIKEVPAGLQQASIDVSKYPSEFYKIVLEGKHNRVNRWVINHIAQ